MMYGSTQNHRSVAGGEVAEGAAGGGMMGEGKKGRFGERC